MLKLGVYNKLEVLRQTSVGMFLGDDEEEVLLPNKYIPEGAKVSDMLDVFIYTDSEDRLIATTLTPTITLHNFAYLEVRQVARFGAFMDWGLEKDLLVPNGEQAERMTVGNKYAVTLYQDKHTRRLAGSTKLKSFLKGELTVKQDEEVKLFVSRKTDLGYQVVINNKHLGLLFHDEVFQPVKVGDNLTGYIKKIKEDGNIDITLRKKGYTQVVDSQQVILDYLKKNSGVINLTDKSDPADIKAQLQMSKATFKKAIGGLYRDKLITLEGKGIRLN